MNMIYVFFIILLIIFIIFFFIKKYIDENPVYYGKIKILYEDDYIIVIDKPANISVHDAEEWYGKTIVDTLIYNGYNLYKNEYELKDGVVHRLDVGTSGVMVLAKNKLAYENLKKQFENRSVIKIYHALIEGIPNQLTGVINYPISIIDDEYNIYGITDYGKPSITHYKTLKIFENIKIVDNVSLVEIKLETGRTHQIRVHFSSLNHPLVGDTKYGSNPFFNNFINLHRQWLHSKYLEFSHPATNEQVKFTSDYAEDLKISLNNISK